MTHKINYEDIRNYMLNQRLLLASSVGVDGSKRLEKLRDMFVVTAGRSEHLFDDLSQAVETYNQTPESV